MTCIATCERYFIFSHFDSGFLGIYLSTHLQPVSSSLFLIIWINGFLILVRMCSLDEVDNLSVLVRSLLLIFIFVAMISRQWETSTLPRFTKRVHSPMSVIYFAIYKFNFASRRFNSWFFDIRGNPFLRQC